MVICGDILYCFGNKNPVNKFRKFVADDIDHKMKTFYDDSETMSVYEKIPILGSKSFIKHIDEHHIKSSEQNAIAQQMRI